MSNFLIIYDKDSHKKATSSLKVALLEGNNNVNEISYGDLITDLKILSEFTVFIISTGGKKLNFIFEKIKFYNNNAITVSLFPGIVTFDQVEAYITRFKVDYVLLNSRKDYSFYKKICTLCGIRFNGLLYGTSWYLPTQINNSTHEESVVVILQDNMLSEMEVLKFKKALVNIKKNNPRFSIYIKPRGLDDKSLFYHLSRLGVFSLENIYEYKEDMQSCTSRFNKMITISSSSALECLIANIDVYILKEFHAFKNHTHFFNKSDLFIYSTDVNLGLPRKANAKWSYNNVYIPKPEDTIAVILGNKKREFFINKYRLWLCKLPLVLYVSLLTNFNSRNVRKKIQSAIEVVTKNDS